MYRTALSHGLMTAFLDLYMYVYMYGWERLFCCVTVWLYFFGENYLVMALLLFINFSASIWNWHALFVYSFYDIWGNDASQKTFVIYFGFKIETTALWKIFLLCLWLQMGMTTSWILLITLCYSTFYLDIYLVDEIHFVSIFNGYIPLVSVNFITRVYQITCVITFNSCFVYNRLVLKYICYVC